MKSLRQFCAAAVLTFVLTLSTLAGNMATGAVPPPPPDPPSSVMGEIVTGVTATSETGTETAFVDPVTAFTLDFLQSFLSLF